MEDLALLNELKALHTDMKTRTRARHLPGWYYNSSQLHTLEKRRIFSSDWFCLGRKEQVSKVGDYFSLEIAGESIFVCRSKDQRIRAFGNYCPHRGAQIVSESGNKSKLVCPYHGWVFDLTGKLINAPLTEDVEEFDFDKCRLSSIPLEEWRGWLFVSISVPQISFEEFIREHESHFDYFQMENCRLTDVVEMEVEANWKLVVENFIDVYHFSTLHSKTFGAPSNPAVGLAYEVGKRTIYRPGHRFSNPRVSSPFGDMPWLPQDHNTAAGSLPPNAYLIGHSDCVRLFSAWPQGEKHTVAKVHTVFPQVFVEREDFEEKTADDKIFVRKVLSEDLDMMQRLQKATESCLFDPGPFAKLEEGVFTVIKDILSRLVKDAKHHS